MQTSGYDMVIKLKARQKLWIRQTKSSHQILLSEGGTLQVACPSEDPLRVESCLERESHYLQGYVMVSHPLVDSPKPMYIWTTLIALVFIKKRSFDGMGCMVREYERTLRSKMDSHVSLYVCT